MTLKLVERPTLKLNNFYGLKFITKSNGDGAEHLKTWSVDLGRLVVKAVSVDVAFDCDVIVVEHLADDIGRNKFVHF